MYKTLILVGIVALPLTACSASASLVRKDVQGGLVALHGPFMPAMSDAQLVMADHCAGRFFAEERGETVAFQCAEHGTASGANRASSAGL